MGGLVIIDLGLVTVGFALVLITGQVDLLMGPILLAVIFNVIIGMTNSPNSVDSKFRKWLFKR